MGLDKVKDALAGEDYYPGDIVPDGQFHRFKRKGSKDKVAWYKCYQNHSMKDGKVFYVILFGDWREGEWNNYCSFEGVQSRDEKKFVAKQIEKAEKELHTEKDKLHEECSAISERLWPTLEKAFTGENTYLKNKIVKDAHGVRFDTKGTIYVPLKDLDGKFWGFQRIFENGDKRLTYGTKMKGNFFLIGKIAKKMLICEGYSTGCSLNEATGLPVIVAISSTNLVNVCKLFPETELILCADDDVYNEKNSGREFAEKAAATRVVFPTFKNKESKPTDFNDLHKLEGIDQVKKQVLSSEGPANFLIALGHRGNDYFFTSSSNLQIIKITASGFSKNTLRDLMPSDYWEKRYPGEGKDSINWDAAFNYLMVCCRKQGVFDDENVRGVGLWLEDGIPVINRGDRLHFKGDDHPLNSFQHSHIYQIGRKIVPAVSLASTADEGKELLNALKLLRWQNKSSARLLAGWLFLARAAGALDWRPHLWLSGPSGSGKSTVLNLIVNKSLGKMREYSLGPSTEAGIRQRMRSDAIPLIADEMESQDELSDKRVQKVVELARQASSDSEGQIFRGTPQGQALNFRARFCCFFSSIRVSLLHEADRTRFAILELRRPEEDPIRRETQFNELMNALKVLDDDFSDKMFGRLYQKMDLFQENMQTFWKVLRRDHSPRVGQQFGTLLAAQVTLTSDNPIPEENAKTLCKTLKLNEYTSSPGEEEEIECIDHLLQKRVRYRVTGDRGEMSEQTVSEMIRATWVETGNEHYVDPLGSYGIRVDVAEGVLYVAQKHAELASIYKGTPWGLGWSKSLARIKGAVNGKSQRIPKGGKNIKCVKIPLDEVFGADFLKEDEEDDIPF